MVVVVTLVVVVVVVVAVEVGYCLNSFFDTNHANGHLRDIVMC